jgi:hypothetical protein
LGHRLRYDDEDELPLEANFIEQAEYIDTQNFLSLSTEHPDEEGILRKLMGGGAKLLIGPRGCGKSTLMLKAFHRICSQNPKSALPVYVNFKLALKVEPLYSKGANAPFWFKAWLILKVFEGIHQTFDISPDLIPPDSLPTRKEIRRLVSKIESGVNTSGDIENFNIQNLQSVIEEVLEDNNLQRCILLIDDAAHAFSEKQQEDFFDFFRSVKTKHIAPKAAVYPGITSHSASFQVGHDAEQIDAWVKPNGKLCENFMIDMARKRLAGTSISVSEDRHDDFIFLAYASFGIPRAFLGMLRAIFNSPESFINSEGKLSKPKLLQLSRQGKDMSHAVYDALIAKVPSLKSYVVNGNSIYDTTLSNIKVYNSKRSIEDQALQFGIRQPIDTDLEKVFGFLQYAGLIMYSGDSLRGENGTFSVYEIHIGDLISTNSIIGKRTKSIGDFLTAIRSTKHQAWPRTFSDKLIESAKLEKSSFFLSLPQCQVCGTERSSPDARFCFNCGAQLKSASTYENLSGQDISVLPISSAMKARIKEHSQLTKVRDILIDNSREQLMKIPYIKKARAIKIVGAAEEFVS